MRRTFKKNALCYSTGHAGLNRELNQRFREQKDATEAPKKSSVSYFIYCFGRAKEVSAYEYLEAKRRGGKVEIR